MIKFSRNIDFDFGVESVKIITDNSQLTKRASAKELMSFKKTKGQTDVHMIALGAYEGTGVNRNGDLFFEKDCREKHATFVKADRAFHKHHKNKPTDPKYGNIKASAYNEPMKRIELIVGIDNDKGADMLSELEKKGGIAVSMAAKLPYDVCTWCGKKAKTDEDRCEHIPLMVGELNKKGEVCAMENPNPNWFEISYVKRPADRIGYSLKYASASVAPMTTSDFLNFYTGFVPPKEELLISKRACDKRSLLRKLADIEKHMTALAHKAKPDTAKELYLKSQASKLNQGDDISEGTMDELRKYEPSKLLKVLADNGILFSPSDFCKYLFDKKIGKGNIEGMKTHLPSIFGDMEDDAKLPNEDKFDPTSSSLIPKEIKDIVGKLFDDQSLFGQPAQGRIMRITIIKNLKNGDLGKDKEKTASDFDRELAVNYAAYKVAALQYLEDNNKLTDELMTNAVIQNRK